MIALGDALSPAQLRAIARGALVSLGAAGRQRMLDSHALWQVHGPEDILAAKEAWLVGIATGPASPTERMHAFVRGHCAGVGDPLPTEHVRALMVARANALAAGQSGCRPVAVEILCAMLNAGVHPVVPGLGSVGAAGDLAPLAHVAQVALRLGGEAERGGVVLPAAEAMAGLPKFTPSSKEALSLINGASLTVALGALALEEARELLRISELALAMSMEVVLANPGCLDERLLGARGHQGAVDVAARVRGLLKGSKLVIASRKADAFSIRCAPAVLGAANRALEYVGDTIERELNGACDNPLVFEDGVLEGGNFHGAPVALGLDHLKVALTQVASISERRTFRLTYGRLTGNLPSFLLESTGVNSGFMLAQYTAASLVSECKGRAHPASVDSIPTGQHHEDHVPMGPIAARGLLAIVRDLGQVLGIELLVAAQGLEFRREGRAFAADGSPLPEAPIALAPRVEAALERIRQDVPRWTTDRVLHHDLAGVVALVRNGALLEPGPGSG